MRIFLVRHGEAADDVNGTIGCECDDPLTELGRWQARSLAARLAEVRFGSIWASPLSRATDTARVVCASNGGTLRTTPALMEIRAGVLAGMSRPQAEGAYPELFEAWASGGDATPAGGENQRTIFYPRVRAFYREQLADDRDRDAVLIVTHAGPANVILNEFFDLEYADYPAFRLQPGSLSVFGLDRGRRSVECINATGHLECPLIHTTAPSADDGAR